MVGENSINKLYFSSFVRMSSYFSMRLIPLSAASLLTSVMRDDSSQNVLNIESSVHFIGDFLRNDTDFFAFLHENPCTRT